MAAPQKPDLQAPAIPMPKIDTPSVNQPEPPLVDQSKMAKSLQPFIDLGKDIASGKSA